MGTYFIHRQNSILLLPKTQIYSKRRQIGSHGPSETDSWIHNNSINGEVGKWVLSKLGVWVTCAKAMTMHGDSFIKIIASVMIIFMWLQWHMVVSLFASRSSTTNSNYIGKLQNYFTNNDHTIYIFSFSIVTINLSKIKKQNMVK